ncbi:MAG TPA: hypothetical protein VHQ91_06925, partial [Geminicoccaceae bacterium]|nr:hypothetical protein [Geminicoccaceae bacterium]
MLRRVGLALGAGLGLVLLLIGAAFALAQTGPGQRVLQASLERALSGSGTKVEIDGLRGLVPFDLRLARLGFANAEGLRFEISDLHLAWSPAALLHGRIEIPALTAERIRLDHLSSSDEPLRLPELPRSLPPIVVERLAAPQIELGPDVLGEPATFSLAGHLAGSDDGRAVVLGLDARRIDQPTASASLDGRLNLDPAALQLRLDATETGGLLARLSGRPNAGDFNLHLAGSGPLDAWTGDLRLDAERLARADARLKITFAQRPQLRLEGSLQPAPGLLPAQIAALVGERLALAMTVMQPAAQRLNVQDLRLATASGELSGQAEVDLDRRQLS